MRLTVRSAARFLNTSEKTILRMVRCNAIPAHRVRDQYRFNRTELLEWAVAHHVKISQAMLQNEDAGDTDEMPRISEALKQGGVYYRLEGKDKATVLRAMVNVLKLPDNVDRELLFRMHLNRESMASTGIGEGIAIPHVRDPVVLQISDPIITLCFLETPVDFQAVDGKPVFALFAMATPTIRVHLFLLSRLVYALKDENILDVIRSRAASEHILSEFARVESAFPPEAGEIKAGGMP